LQEEIPVNKVNIVFRSPEYFKFQTHRRGWLPFNLQTSNKERKIYFHERTRDLSSFSDMKSESRKREMKFQENGYEINLTDVPALKKEAFAGNINNYATAIHFEMSHMDFPGQAVKTYASTWEDVSKNIYKVDSFGPEVERTN